LSEWTCLAGFHVSCQLPSFFGFSPLLVWSQFTWKKDFSSPSCPFRGFFSKTPQMICPGCQPYHLFFSLPTPQVPAFPAVVPQLLWGLFLFFLQVGPSPPPTRSVLGGPFFLALRRCTFCFRPLLSKILTPLCLYSSSFLPCVCVFFFSWFCFFLFRFLVSFLLWHLGFSFSFFQRFPE